MLRISTNLLNLEDFSTRLYIRVRDSRQSALSFHVVGIKHVN